MARTYREELFSPQSTNRFIQPQAKRIADPVFTPSSDLRQTKQSAQEAILFKNNGGSNDGPQGPSNTSTSGPSNTSTSPSTASSVSQALGYSNTVSSIAGKMVTAAVPYAGIAVGIGNVVAENTIGKALGVEASFTNTVKSAFGYGASTTAAKNVGLRGSDFGTGKEAGGVVGKNARGNDRFGGPRGELDDTDEAAAKGKASARQAKETAQNVTLSSKSAAQKALADAVTLAEKAEEIDKAFAAQEKDRNKEIGNRTLEQIQGRTHDNTASGREAAKGMDRGSGSYSGGAASAGYQA